jgi:sugar lactone lactonase YvrE
MDTVAVELVLDANASLGEGAIWDSRKRVLYWVDIEAGEVHVYDPATGKDRAVSCGQQVGTVVPRAKGGVMVALRDGFAALDLDTGTLTMIADPEADKPRNRFNDGKCDPRGRFWAGTLGQDGGALYRMDTDLSVTKVLEGIGTSNGIAWSLDRKTMYYIDTRVQEVWAFDYDDATGAIANKRTAISVPRESGHPDGSTLDAEGNLWVAHWDGWNVTCYDPKTGRALRRIDVPAQRVTSVAFGGPDLDTLYITTARIGLNDADLKKQPHAGGLFRCRPGVKGIPAPEFGG